MALAKVSAGDRVRKEIEKKEDEAGENAGSDRTAGNRLKLNTPPRRTTTARMKAAARKGFGPGEETKRHPREASPRRRVTRKLR